MRTRFARSGASSSITSRVAMSRRQGNGDFEAGALAGGAIEADGPAVQVERFLYDREPEAGARDTADVARPVERLEQPRLVLGRYADAAVRYLERSRAVQNAHAEVHRAPLRGVL